MSLFPGETKSRVAVYWWLPGEAMAGGLPCLRSPCQVPFSDCSREVTMCLPPWAQLCPFLWAQCGLCLSPSIASAQVLPKPWAHTSSCTIIQGP